jgi:Flp pilus assembly protein CpaB
VLAPTPPAGRSIVIAAHDLAAGSALAAGDLRSADVPAGLAPAGAVLSARAALGRVLAAPLRRGEPLTDVRLAGADLLAGDGGALVAVPVRIADAASVALVAAGDHVDVLAAVALPGRPPSAQVVAPSALVLAVPTAVEDAGDGALLVVAASPGVAARLAAAALGGRLSLTLRGRG